ncbi:MAG: hypothetical protein K0R83_28 [Caulobacter sp.]|jgi:AcrR family transcriptional regulator|nr:hypothetical protein [Caulobacter sp.]
MGVALSGHEIGKVERRRRIVEAADALVRELGFEAVSMVDIARRAGLSPATLYNLFQTKAAIYGEVFDRDLAQYERLVEAAPAADALERLFAAVDIAAGLYAAQPAFYRAMMQAGMAGGVLRRAISEPRQGFWQGQVANAVADGALRPGVDVVALGAVVTQLVRGALTDWASGAISAERLRQESAYGIGLMLLANVAEPSAPALRSRIAGLEAALRKPA